VPMLQTSQLKVARFFPEMRKCRVLTESITRDDEYYDVLLLGGSVVTDEYGTIAPLLRERLATLTERKVRLFNVGACSHTSRDSLLKYRMLEGKEFDLVVFYHAINETRMNNCPREMFRADYSHASWYDRLSRLERHRELNYFILPYTLEYLITGVLDSPKFGYYLPRHNAQDGQWLDHGSEIKTTECFRANLSEIVELARKRGAEVLLPTYAYSLPADYSLAKMKAHELDFAAHKTPVEVWGKPEAVIKGIEAHNTVTREIGRANRHVILVDLAAEMAGGAKNFDDVCHLTGDGCRSWVEAIDVPVRRNLSAVAAAQRLSDVPNTARSPASETRTR